MKDAAMDGGQSEELGERIGERLVGKSARPAAGVRSAVIGEALEQQQSVAFDEARHGTRVAGVRLRLEHVKAAAIGDDVEAVAQGRARDVIETKVDVARREAASRLTNAAERDVRRDDAKTEL